MCAPGKVCGHAFELFPVTNVLCTESVRCLVASPARKGDNAIQRSVSRMKHGKSGVLAAVLASSCCVLPLLLTCRRVGRESPDGGARAVQGLSHDLRGCRPGVDVGELRAGHQTVRRRGLRADRRALPHMDAWEQYGRGGILSLDLVYPGRFAGEQRASGQPGSRPIVNRPGDCGYPRSEATGHECHNQCRDGHSATVGEGVLARGGHVVTVHLTAVGHRSLREAPKRDGHRSQLWQTPR